VFQIYDGVVPDNPVGDNWRAERFRKCLIVEQL
jgi:hypothetical protein